MPPETHEIQPKSTVARKLGTTLRAVRRRATPSLMGHAAAAATLALIAIVTIVGAAMYSLISQTPEWWRTVDTQTPEAITLAKRVERGLMNAVHEQHTVGKPWTISITPAQANAWLNVKMPRWLEHKQIAWPDAIAEVQTNFISGRIVVGFKLITDEGDRFVAATVSPTLPPDGSLWLTIAKANAGRLDLPSGWTIKQLDHWLPEEIREEPVTRTTLDALAGNAPLFEQATIKLEDGRRIRLTKLTTNNEGQLLVTFQNEPRD